jgi:predicted SAM-dependent methyltransferase
MAFGSGFIVLPDRLVAGAMRPIEPYRIHANTLERRSQNQRARARTILNRSPGPLTEHLLCLESGKAKAAASGTMGTPRFLNIACGATYVRSAEWENVDYASRDPFVRQSDILGGLKTTQPKYEAVYCSHFLEHIPPEKVSPFLLRCRSLMGDNSLLRIVVPDSEGLLREYLKQKDSGNEARADFAFVNFLDQCVRVRRGGRLGDYLEQIASGKRDDLKSYAEYINGQDAKLAAANANVRISNAAKLLRLASQPQQILSKLEPCYIELVCSFLPRAFREQNVSFAGVGEKHLWMYDFESLKAVLQQAGFSQIERQDFNKSSRADNPFAPLDEVDGMPRKGSLQLFVEAYA